MKVKTTRPQDDWATLKGEGVAWKFCSCCSHRAFSVAYLNVSHIPRAFLVFKFGLYIKRNHFFQFPIIALCHTSSLLSCSTYFFAKCGIGLVYLSHKANSQWVTVCTAHITAKLKYRYINRRLSERKVRPFANIESFSAISGFGHRNILTFGLAGGFSSRTCTYFYSGISWVLVIGRSLRPPAYLGGLSNTESWTENVKPT